MKKRIVLIVFALSMLNLSTSLYSYASYNDMHNGNESIMGKSGRAAMRGIDLVYNDDWVYFKNDSNQLERRHMVSKTRDVLTKENMTQINVVGNFVYGFISSEDGKQQGIYQIGIDNKKLVKLNDGYASNLLVVDDWVYFKKTEKSGIMRMKTDGSQLEEVYKGHVKRFTVYRGHIYFFVDAKLAKITVEGKSFYRYSIDYSYFDDFIIKDDKIYVYGSQKTNKTKLLSISLDGNKSDEIRNMSITDDLAIYKDKIYFGRYNYLRNMSMSGYAGRRLTGNLKDYIIQDNHLIISLESTSLDEVWHIDLDTMSEQRIVPKHYEQFKDIKSLLEQVIDVQQDMKQWEASIVIDKTKEYSSKEREKLDFYFNVDYENNNVNERFVKEGKTYEAWITEGDNIIVNSEQERWYHYGEGVGYTITEIFSDRIIKESEVFDLARTGTFNENKTHYILKFRDENRLIHGFLRDKLYVFKESVWYIEIMDLVMYINKETLHIDRITAKKRKKIDTGYCAIDIRNAYNGKGVEIPHEINVIMERKKDAEASIKKGYIALNDGKLEEALEYSDKALDICNFIKEAYLLKAEIAYAQDDLEEVIKQGDNYLSMFHRFGNSSVKITELMAESYYLLGDYKDAREYAKRINNLKLAVYEGLCDLEEEKHERAEGIFDRVLEADPLMREAILGKIAILNLRGEYAKSNILVEQNLERLNDSKTMWYFNGINQHNLGNVKEGIESFKRVLELPGRSLIPIKDYTVCIDIVHSYITIGEYDLAEDYVNSVDTTKDSLRLFEYRKESLLEQIEYGRLPSRSK